MKVVCFSLRKLVQEMKTNENCGSKEALKVLEMFKGEMKREEAE